MGPKIDSMEERKVLLEKYEGDKRRFGTAFSSYTRYFEADILVKQLMKHGVIMPIHVLDYGCGMGDYGMTFLRLGNKVTFYDYTNVIKFVHYRSKAEPNKLLLFCDSLENYKNDIDVFESFGPPYDLVIFGEVLEHLRDPLVVLAKCADLKFRYIFTSSYPYRDEDPSSKYWNKGGHSFEARKLQPQCRELLEQNYTFTKFDGELRLWKLK